MKRFPDELKAGQTVPAVITIHGGNWSVDSGVTKDYYNYMTAFITGDCGCVHVNMEYRRLGSDGGLDDTKAPYQQMLDDIQSAISYLQSHAATYHIDASKIALMGHSAGGHLALLYAYMAKQGNYNYGDNIQLVISEAGPTDFTNFEGISTNNQDIRNGFESSLMQLSALTGVEYTIQNYENNTEYPGAWEDASPIYYVSTNQGNNFPYTILAYGSNVNTPQGNNPFISGDSVVAYSQATSLADELDANKYTLFTLNGVGHNTVGEGETVYPGSITKDANLTQAISDYYDKISKKLQELNEQENN